MQVLERVRQTEFLGRDFLTWLWFKSETNNGRFDLEALGTAEVWFDGRVTLQPESDQDPEIITCIGANSRLSEARFALTKNKKVTQALVKLIMGDHEWTFALDSLWMNFKSLKSPKVLFDKEDDPDGLFYEKAFFMEQPIRAIDMIFASFIRLRTSPEWDAEELPALISWINEVR